MLLMVPRPFQGTDNNCPREKDPRYRKVRVVKRVSP